jgi:hypothetical protein
MAMAASSMIPLRSTTNVGSDYATALTAHWQDPEYQVIDKFKALWKRNVLDKDNGGVRFSETFGWPTKNYLGYEDTYGHKLREADKLLADPR